MVLRFEDLRDQPAAVVADVLRFVGASCDERLYRYAPLPPAMQVGA
jgi:hypothetical protein